MYIVQIQKIEMAVGPRSNEGFYGSYYKYEFGLLIDVNDNDKSIVTFSNNRYRYQVHKNEIKEIGEYDV